MDTERCVRQRFEPGLGDGFAAARAFAILAGIEAGQGLVDLVELGSALAVQVSGLKVTVKALDRRISEQLGRLEKAWDRLSETIERLATSSTDHDYRLREVEKRDCDSCPRSRDIGVLEGRVKTLEDAGAVEKSEIRKQRRDRASTLWERYVQGKGVWWFLFAVGALLTLAQKFGVLSLTP